MGATPERLRDKVREAMTYRDGARRIASAFAVAGGPAAAADAVERRLLVTASGGTVEDALGVQ